MHSGAWLAATSGAVALSWFGVHSVLTGTAYDPPRALPVTGNARQPTDGTSSSDPVTSSTSRPKPSATSNPSTTPSGNASAANTPASPAKSPRSSPSRAGEVRSYSLQGGRVALELGPTWAKLVSATPNDGYQMQVWEEAEWIRVDFSTATHTSSLFCTWNGHPPAVQTVEQ